MKFEALIAYWKMKDMIRHQSCQTNDTVYNSDVSHLVYAISVTAGGEHANIIYRYEMFNGVKSKFALIYADILFSGFPQWDGHGSRVFIKNAKVSDLVEHLVNQL